MGIPWYENLIWEKEHQDFLKGLYREQLSISEYVRQVATMHNPRALPPEEFYQILDYLKVCKSNIEANQSWRFGKNELNTLIELYNTFDERVQTFYEANDGSN